jgi:hypothetical protein
MKDVDREIVNVVVNPLREAAGAQGSRRGVGQSVKVPP